jgi:hypothetical protein
MPPGSRRPGRARSKVAAGAPCRARAPARKGRDGESRRIVPRAVGSAPFYQQSMSVGIVQYHTDTTGGSGAHNDHLSPRYHSRRWRCDRSQGTAGLSPFGRIFCCSTNISMPTQGSGSGRRTRPVGPGFSRTSSRAATARTFRNSEADSRWPHTRPHQSGRSCRSRRRSAEGPGSGVSRGALLQLSGDTPVHERRVTREP